MTIEQYLRAAPKAELHVHLEGSMQPRTLLTLARRNRVPLPAEDEASLREWFTYRTFQHFLDIYVTITRCLRRADDYELIVYEYAAAAARQNVRYAEVTFSPGSHYSRGVPQEMWFRGLSRGRERARADFGVEINWVFDIVRSVEDEAENRRLADYTTAVAIEGKNEGVVAFGLGGGEIGYPPERFSPWFDRARAAGLHSAPHAGEVVGPESVWGAVRALGAERIGHGVRAIEDPALVSYLAEHAIPLELNPTSNVRLGVYPAIVAHPLPHLHAAGVVVTVNSDDPPLFNTTLNDEVALLDRAFGMDVTTSDAILLNGVRHSFLPHERKRALEAEYVAELDALKASHLP